MHFIPARRCPHEVLHSWTLPTGSWLVSEPTLVPKAAGRPGDGVWVLCVGTTVDGDARTSSSVYMLDGEDLGAGPVCEVEVPGGGLPYGLHSCWVDELAS